MFIVACTDPRVSPEAFLGINDGASKLTNLHVMKCFLQSISSVSLSQGDKNKNGKEIRNKRDIKENKEDWEEH